MVNSEQNQPKIIIRTISIRGNTLPQDLEQAFKQAGAVVNLEVSSPTRKHFSEIEVVLTFLTGAFANQAMGRYGFDPIFEWLERLAKPWVPTLEKKQPLQPISFILKLEGINIIIKTEPYVISEEWILNFCENIAVILEMLNFHPDFEDVKTIRVVSNTIDDVKVLAYKNSQRPAYFVDLGARTIQSVNDAEKDSYVFETNHDDKTLGILGFSDERDIETFIRIEKWKHSLYTQIIERKSLLDNADTE